MQSYWLGRGYRTKHFSMKKNSGDIGCRQCLRPRSMYQRDKPHMLVGMQPQQSAKKFQQDTSGRCWMTFAQRRRSRSQPDRVSNGRC